MSDTTPAPAAPAAPDAVRMPTGWLPPGFSYGDPGEARHTYLSQLLGGRPFYRDHARANEVYVTLFADAAACLLQFPERHRFAGMPRFDWAEKPDGLVYGTLTDQARAERDDPQA